MHLALAAAIPILFFLAVTWRRPDRRTAWLLAALAAAYAAPYVALQSTPVAVDFLLREAPWAAATPPGYLQKNPLINDVPLQMVPWQEAARAAWKSGSLPLLDRATAAGSTLWANPQSAVLFPASLLGAVTGTFAWPLLSLVTKLLLALWGTYLLLGRHSLSPYARVFGAVAYAFSTFALTFALFPHTNVTALLPLLLASLHGVLHGWRGTAVSACVLVLMLAGGHPESVVHAALVAIPYAAVLAWPRRTERLRLAARFTALGITAVLVTLPLLLPFASLIPQTQRYFELHEHALGQVTPPPTLENLTAILIPNYFGNPRVHNYRHAFNYNELVTQYAGLSTFALAVAAATAAPRRHRFWIALLALSFPLAFQPPALTRLLAEIPVIGLAPHGRIRVVITLALAVLGAHGLELLLRGERRKLLASVAGAVAAAVAIICLASYPTFAEFGVRRLIFFTEIVPIAATALVAFAALRHVPRAGMILPLLLFADLAVTTLLYNPPNDRSMFYPRTPAIDAMRSEHAAPMRITGIDRAFLPITARFYGLEDIRAHDPVAWRPYVAVLDAAGWDRSDYFGRFRSMPPQALLDFLGVRYVIAEPTQKPLPLPVAYAGADAIVYRNDSAAPRFFIPSSIERSPDPISAFLQNNVRDRVFSDSIAMKTSPAEISIERYEPNGATLRVRATGETFVASSEPAMPGWSVRRNGSPWPAGTINGPFLGWRVPRGTSTFRIEYQPPYLNWSAAGTLLGLAILAWMFFARSAQRDAIGS